MRRSRRFRPLNFGISCLLPPCRSVTCLTQRQLFPASPDACAQEELTIRAMTTYERRRPRDPQESDSDLCSPPSKRTSGHLLSSGGSEDLKGGSRGTRRHSRGRQEEGPVGKPLLGGSTAGVRELDGYLSPRRNIEAISRDGVINRELAPPADSASAIESGATASWPQEKEAARAVDDTVTSVASGSRDQARYDPTSIGTAGSDGPDRFVHARCNQENAART